MGPQRRLSLNRHDAQTRRTYKRLWQRQHRVYVPRPALQDAAALFEAAMDHARRTQVALPRDPVLDAWRVQKVVRIAFDSRFGPYWPALQTGRGRCRVPCSEGEGKERVAPPRGWWE